MPRSIEAKVLKEIEPYKTKYGERWGSFFFNNFDTNLPGGYRTGFEPNILDNKPRDDDKPYSKRRRGQTSSEFLEECRTAVLEAAIPLERIIDARTRYQKESDRSFFDLLLPVYTILRARGYIRYKDLTS